MVLRSHNPPLQIIDREIAFFDGSMWAPFKKGSGKPAEPLIIIKAFWSLVIRKGNYADMQYIDSLINWFHNQLEAKEYGGLLVYEPNRTSINRFLKINKDRLEKDRKFFFPTGDESSKESAIVKRTIQIRFAAKSPEIYSFAGDAQKRKCRQIIFNPK